jgi:hypothetical protein
MTDKSLGLSIAHRQALHARGLIESTVAYARQPTLTDAEQAGALLHWDGLGQVPGMVIPLLKAIPDAER